MAGPRDEMAAGAAGREPMRASHADRDRVIEVLKDAFVHGQLTMDELDARAGRALAARTCAELVALTADIPSAPRAPAASAPAASAPAASAPAASAPAASAPAASAPVASGPTRPPVPVRHRPLARAVARSGGCLALAAAAVWASFILDPGGPGADRPWAGLMLLVAQYTAITGVCILWSGVATSVQERRFGKQLSPRRGPGGHALAAGAAAGGAWRRSGPSGRHGY
jgi:hypothetical protein